MPILKVPVVHKFGIISHCQRLNLQSRLLNDINISKYDDDENLSSRNPFEITDEFVEKYNTSQHSSNVLKKETKKLNDIADKFFLKIKRRIGLQYNCENEGHINVALGWTELTTLSQCHGDISNKCLDLLYMSLSVAPFHQSNFLVLFYLLESALYFLQTSTFQSRHPDKHIKWLQIAELVSLRIYIQCKLRYSQCPRESVDNLKLYIKNFDKCQSDFIKYPETAISFCVIYELCDYLSSICTVEEKETSKHDISSLLWHSVDLWQCSFYSTQRPQIQESINSIKHCLANNPSFGNWIDCYSSFRVLANVASFQRMGLDIFESIILGLSEVNSEMEQRNPSGNKEEDKCVEEISARKICGFERGTILLFAAIREFSSLPLLCITSAEREQTLSIISRWLIENDNDSLCKFPISAKQIMSSRLKAILELTDQTITDQRYIVLKNSIWLLLESVQRKNILMTTFSDSQQYGKMVSSLMFSSELAPNPHFINERISQAIFSQKHIFPISSQSEMEQISSSKTVKSLQSVSQSDCHKKPRIGVQYPPKKIVIQSKKTPEYIKESDMKLRNILQKFWESELPELEKQISEEEASHKQ